MHTKRIRIAIISLAVVFSLLATYAIAGPALASLGNRGVPVYGRVSGPIPMSESKYLNLYAADGSFTMIDTVPAGKYLLVTDIEFTPDAGTDTAGVVSATLMVEGTGQNLVLRSTDTQTHSINCTTPIFVLSAGQKLKASNAWFSDEWVYVHIAGMLVDNVSYIPVVVSE